MAPATITFDASALWRQRDPSQVHLERAASEPATVERLVRRVFAPWQRAVARGLQDEDVLLLSVSERSQAFADCSDAELLDAVGRCRLVIGAGEADIETLASVFALVQTAAMRTFGYRHHDVQLIGGAALLSGQIAEMGTGEGKTLTATLPAAAAALAGIPVHVVTVNDYLAGRDAEKLAPLFSLLGLTTGCVVGETDPSARRGEYERDITYCTGKEVAFDYLRDRASIDGRTRIAHRIESHLAGDQARPLVVARGLGMAIVDEVDSVLIDEARTPLILSALRDDDEERALYEAAIDVARGFRSGEDFLARSAGEGVRLTDQGRARAKDETASLSGLWRGARRREMLVTQALVALHDLKPDVHYLVREDRVEIVDEFTGRVMPDRSWEAGLHQLVEVKEGLAPSGRHEPISRTTLPDFFRRYLLLCGMTGTAEEVSAELWSTYRLATTRIPPHRESRRASLGDTVSLDRDEHGAVLVARITEVAAARRPVLVGTRTVEGSRWVSSLLEERKIPHRVLNAIQDEDEARIIAEAGRPGSVTVATNMAGRGTDIPLEDGAAEQGGLHVILTARHDSRRVDRQLFGRCARQGDPGSFESILSLDDELLTRGGMAVRLALSFARWLGGPGGATVQRFGIEFAQRRRERLHARERRDLRRAEARLGRLLGFAGGAR